MEVKVPVLGFCAMKAAINRLNKIECSYYGPEESTVGTLNSITTPVNLRGIGNYLDGLATVLETQIAQAPADEEHGDGGGDPDDVAGRGPKNSETTKPAASTACLKIKGKVGSAFKHVQGWNKEVAARSYLALKYIF